MNVLVNGCQAIEEKRKNTPTHQGRIEVQSAEVDSTIVITIKDNGCGMNESTIQHVFDPFFSTKDVGSGTGLGMSISYGIIEEHNGTITVDSTDGVGAKVTIVL